MTDVWETIAVVGKIITLLAVAPFIAGMGWLLISTDIQSAEPELALRGTKLMVGAIMAIVPLSLGGALLFAFFQFAEEQAGI